MSSINKLMALWQTMSIDKHFDSAVTFTQEELNQVMSKFFCPGPFYFYVFDFSKMGFMYVHPNIENILGLDSHTLTLDQHMELIHPEDLGFALKCEEMALNFYSNKLKVEQRKKYKVSYCVRFRGKDGQYKMFLHQAIATSLGEEGNLLTIFGVHSDISNLEEYHTRTLALVGLYGEPSYTGITVGVERNEFSPLMDHHLTNRELEVLLFLAEGNTVKEISQKLVLAEDTVRTHRNNIRNKLNARNTTQAVATAIRKGWI